jgi:hypothetical protein
LSSGLTFRQVDVFTGVPFKGNPVAVVHDADRLSVVRSLPDGARGTHPGRGFLAKMYARRL